MKKLILSSFLVAGAAIGSGVLALPILAAGPWLVNTMIFITITFVVAYIIALISIDIYSRYDNHDVNAATLAVDYFGKKGYIFTTLMNVLSMGALAAAYVNAGGDLLAKTVLPALDISMTPQVGMVIFFIVFMPAFVVGISLISRLNSVIFTVKFICLIGGIILGIKLINPDIFQFVPSGVKYLGAGASTMFCIWYMHCVIPLVMKVNDWDVKKSRQAVFVGMAMPALAYLGWMLLIFSLVSRQDFLHLETIGDIMHFALTKPGVPKLISSLVGIFASITVLTAFLSIGFSLVAFVIDALKWNDNPKNRLIATLVSFVLPVIVALMFPKAFVVIYQQSNMFQIASALIPVAAAYKYNKMHKLKISPHIIVILFGAVIILSQILDDFAILPKFH